MTKGSTGAHKSRNYIRLFGAVTFLGVVFNAGLIATAMAGYL